MINTAPTATCCQKGWTPTMMKPFCRTAGISTPKNVPSIVPTPPNRLVPPITTAAIDGHAGAAGALEVRADRVRVAAKPRLGEQDAEHQGDRDGDDDEIRDLL